MRLFDVLSVYYFKLFGSSLRDLIVHFSFVDFPRCFICSYKSEGIERMHG